MPDFVELHDAVLSVGIKLLPHGTIVLDLDNIACYFAESPDVFSVWSCSGRLVLDRCNRFEMEGILGDMSRISDATLRKEDSEVPISKLVNSPITIDLLEIVLTSGTTIVIEGETAHIVELEKCTRLRDWHGGLLE